VLGLFVLSHVETVQKKAEAPAEYQRMYSNLKASLDSYEVYLYSHSMGEKYPVVFGAELLPANSNSGSDPLKSNAMQGVVVYLDRLHELGVQGVTIAIGYPLYLPNLAGYEEYVQFYKQVAQEIKKRGMKMDVEAGVIFAGTTFSKSNISFAGLTFGKYIDEKKRMITAIVQDLHPDYVNMGAEPDTEYINYVLDGLDRGSTKMGAGIGTWGNLAYVKSFAANTKLDFIDMHVYPITGQFLERIQTIVDIAKQYKKKVVLDEGWLYKVDTPVISNVAASAEVFKRDVFSFWAPLDQQFLATLVKSARMNNIEYISPFWTTYFFSYIDYDKNIGHLSYDELSAMVDKSAAKNIVADRLTSTGEFYEKLVSENS